MMLVSEQVRKTVGDCYAVGGCVRDSLMGIRPKDYDFATALHPDEIEAKVRAAGRRAYTTGRRYGTIGFKVDGNFVEVTTFRREQYTEGSRKPQVEWGTDLTADLSRRDFTMNAIALSTKDGKVVDPFDGRFDISHHVIRAVGNPTTRFKEDPLRMLRACRFASQLGFEIDDATFKSIKKNAHLILNVSRERWVQELDKLLTGKDVLNALFMLWDSGLMAFMLPEVAIQKGYKQNSKFHCYDLDVHTAHVVAGVEPDVNLRWAALLHDIGKPVVRTEKPDRSVYVHHERVSAELVRGIALRLNWSKERAEKVWKLVRFHLDPESPLKAADDAAGKNMEEVLAHESRQGA